MTTRTIQNSRLFRVEFTGFPSIPRLPRLPRALVTRHSSAMARPTTHTNPARRIDDERHTIARSSRAPYGRRTGPAACASRARRGAGAGPPAGGSAPSSGARTGVGLKDGHRLRLSESRPTRLLSSMTPESWLRFQRSSPRPARAARIRTAPAAHPGSDGPNRTTEPARLDFDDPSGSRCPCAPSRASQGAARPRRRGSVGAARRPRAPASRFDGPGRPEVD